MNYKEINTTDKMNETVKDTLKMRSDNMSLYALKRIEELEEQLRLTDVSGSVSSMKDVMDSFYKEIQEEIKTEPLNLKLRGAEWGYKMAMDQFKNRFKKHYR